LSRWFEKNFARKSIFHESMRESLADSSPDSVNQKFTKLQRRPPLRPWIKTIGDEGSDRDHSGREDCDWGGAAGIRL
jgi:hypothetical protein